MYKKVVLKVKNPNLEEKTIDFSGFKPVPQNGTFAHLTPSERKGHSDHILDYIHDLNYADLIHFGEGGVLDLKEASKKLGLRLD